MSRLESMDRIKTLERRIAELETRVSRYPVRIGRSSSAPRQGRPGTLRWAILTDTIAVAELDGSLKEVRVARGEATLLEPEKDTDGKTIIPITYFKAAKEDDPDDNSENPAQIDVVRPAINFSGMKIRASDNIPVVVAGELKKYNSTDPNGDEVSEEVLQITTVDLAMLEEFELGSDPEADAVGVFSLGGERRWKAGRSTCEAAGA